MGSVIEGESVADKKFSCLACLNDDCVSVVELPKEVDSDGCFGNFYAICEKCGRKTLDMDTPEDAIEAFCERSDTVNYDGADTLLVTDEYLRRLRAGEIEVVDVKDIRNRLNTGY